MLSYKEKLYHSWHKLYGNNNDILLNDFIAKMKAIKKTTTFPKKKKLWFKKSIVYSLYVDLFNDTFEGLIEKLDYFVDLKIDCLWLLPILDSPMKDAGFDVRDYYSIRTSLFRNKYNTLDSFKKFIDKAHEKDIKIIFDFPLNHVSDEHYWFKQAKLSKNNKYRNYFIWNDDDKKYSEARIIFKGICHNNWEKYEDEYYFHRFFEFQPDLNYRNPQVLIEIVNIFIFWLQAGIDGFRADAIPYLWKENNTNCENLDGTHEILKIIKTIIDYLQPNTLLLAEACQQPKEIVKYFANADECNAGYHFPLMAMIFKSLFLKSRLPIVNVLNVNITPNISDNSGWFLFLRCHDELSLENVYVNEADRKLLHEAYCKNPDWDFRKGEGIASRLSELLDLSPEKILLAYSILLSLNGTPVIYYGDETGKANDYKYYNKQKELTKINDTRYLVRGKLNWKEIHLLCNDNKCKILEEFKKLTSLRSKLKLYNSTSLQFVDLNNDSLLAYQRPFYSYKIFIVNNLSSEEQFFSYQNVNFRLKAYEYKWIKMLKEYEH